MATVFSEFVCHYIYIWIIFFFQPTSPIRAEIDVKLGGTQCNIIISRLKPWMQLHFSKNKKMVLQEGATTNPDKVHSTDSKAIMWTCTVSAPEMTTVLYSLSGFPLYHVSDFMNYLFLFLLGYCGSLSNVSHTSQKKKKKKSNVFHSSWLIIPFFQTLYNLLLQSCKLTRT